MPSLHQSPNPADRPTECELPAMPDALSRTITSLLAGQSGTPDHRAIQAGSFGGIRARVGSGAPASEARGAKASRAVKERKCKTCKHPFQPFNSMQIACSLDCEVALGLKLLERKKRGARDEERRQDKVRAEAIKTRAQWLKEAKVAVQGARRLEELAAGHGCISCGRSQAEVEGTDAWKPGGAWDGGHFLSKGAHPNLALEPMNIWLQCKSCNGGSGKYGRKGATVAAQFRENLIARIGLQAVEAMESDHQPRKYTIHDLKTIKAQYQTRVNQLRRERMT